jgi:hypothetical protein
MGNIKSFCTENSGNPELTLKIGETTEKLKHSGVI